jgi:hypothetical protein
MTTDHASQRDPIPSTLLTNSPGQRGLRSQPRLPAARIAGPSSVVAVAGVGGSGTRVFAQMLIDLGFYMGSDLNHANDNLYFTLLFVRRRWLTRNAGKRELIFKGLDIFSRAMTGDERPSAGDLGFVNGAIAELLVNGHSHLRDGSGLWPVKRAWHMMRPKKLDYSRYIGWGWKEPNTHIYLEYLNEYFKNLKYVHIMRHGLDMAYSHNQRQLFNWGELYGVEIPSADELLPKAALSYWVRANRKALAIGRQMGDDKFLSVNFDEFCAAPKSGVDRLLDFLGVDVGTDERARLYTLFKLPASSGRYREHDLTVLDSVDIEAVRELGFTVET